MLQLRLYQLLMLHLLILGQQQLGPRLGRRLVMLPPCARGVLLDGTCQHGARSVVLGDERRRERGAGSEASVRRSAVTSITPCLASSLHTEERDPTRTRRRAPPESL